MIAARYETVLQRVNIILIHSNSDSSGSKEFT